MSQLFSLADVSEYNGQNGKATWIIIRDVVYDVTSYMDDVSFLKLVLHKKSDHKFNILCIQHPGGGELIAEYAGKDATKSFDDFGHSNDAKKLLKPFRIGELIEVRCTLNSHNRAFGVVLSLYQCFLCLHQTTRRLPHNTAIIVLVLLLITKYNRITK